jgi:hypothetical protein
MAYTPVTMPAGAILATNPADQGVQDNLDKMRNYVDGGVIAADIATDNWADSKHIVHGYYNPITNQHTFVSGLNGGYTAATEEMSFVGDGPTARGAPSNPTDVNFSNTGMNFFLRGTALMQAVTSRLTFGWLTTSTYGRDSSSQVALLVASTLLAFVVRQRVVIAFL